MSTAGPAPQPPHADTTIKRDPGTYARLFRKNWQAATADNNLTLFGLRRFKTSHLLNLRFLEDEIAELDHAIYQAGLTLGNDHAPLNKLGLNYCIRDANVAPIDATITEQLVLRLRELLKQYDDAIIAFNTIMSMERCSLLDDEKAARARTDLTVPEMYETRLLRPDLPPRSRVDPLSHWLHRLLRDLQYWRLRRRGPPGCELGKADSSPRAPPVSSQNSAALANLLGRLVSTLVAGVFLVVPLVILGPRTASTLQLAVVAGFILLFSLVVATLVRASNLETLAVSAAYAAILSVFVSNSS
ncbi:hypothetical protein KVR01_010158 [Diaporthe batatas]|uniref:uncharacterized protein n=1 Tax=Diaporthe batatas TaxID=748121 RepID=UPI001D043C3A|nr:uncharacterized protein KVR01_010158 [Diaporthe batatas]KAG8159521.1 hypothetical protein KVR01_010158 [Diaporthe batatas]